MKTSTIVRNFFITFMLVTVITGYSAAHPDREPKVSEIRAAEPEQIPTNPKPKTKFVTFKVSHYWPPLGGVNCFTFVNSKCVSKMANGVKWEKGVGIAVACPKELKLGTKIYLLDREWTCMDRGSKITKDGDKYWVDMLIPESLVPYGKEVEGEIVL